MRKGIRSIAIGGLRGFSDSVEIRFALPNGHPGSGLTILVGPNNAGKSTVIEALSAISKTPPPTFAEGKRNKSAGDRVSIKVTTSDENLRELATIPEGGAVSRWTGGNAGVQPVYVVPSRRTFTPFFDNRPYQRSTYLNHVPLAAIRGAPIDDFPKRLVYLQENQQKRVEFDNILSALVGPVRWSIEQSDSGGLYFKYSSGEISHNSDGIGEGILSLFFVADALYDSEEGDVIAIDEPEQSLHPFLQKRLRRLLSQQATRLQIIYATHSPYFVDWNDIWNGAELHRIYAKEGRTHIGSVGRATAQKLRGLSRDRHFPHSLGLDSREVFFLADRVILVEGQEDAVFYPQVFKQLGIEPGGEIYGWGVGGADKMQFIASMLKDMGFRRVAGILDSNQESARVKLSAAFPEYRFVTIPAADVRTKNARPPQPEVSGLLNRDLSVRSEHRHSTQQLFESLRAYLAD